MLPKKNSTWTECRRQWFTTLCAHSINGIFKVYTNKITPHEYDYLWCCGGCVFNLEFCHRIWVRLFGLYDNILLHGFSFDVYAHFEYFGPGFAPFHSPDEMNSLIRSFIRSLVCALYYSQKSMNMLSIYLEHVCVSIFFVFNNNRLISWQCVRYRMLIRIQNCLWCLRWLNYIMPRSSHTICFSSFVQYKFWTSAAFVSLWQKTIISVNEKEWEEKNK